MTLRPPAWLQNGESYSASTDRLSVFNMLLERRGVVDPNHMRVTPSNPASMTLEISNGMAIVSSSVAGQGSYSVVNDGPASVTVAPANSNYSRIDKIVLTVRDSDTSGSADEGVFQVISGTPSSNPVAPGTPANSIVLANVSVGRGAGSINTQNIDNNVREMAMLRRSLGSSIFPVNRAEKERLAQQHRGQISSSNPLVVFDTSAARGRELQYTTNGSAWIPVNEAPNEDDLQLYGAGPTLVGGNATNADGYLMQAGSTAHRSSGSGDAKVTFPRSFPNGLITVVVTNGHHEVTGTLKFDLLPAHPTRNKSYSYARNEFFYRVSDINGNAKRNFQHRVNWIAIGW